MGSGNIDVGSATPTREPGQPVEREGKTSEHPASLCGAMSQQGSEFLGNISAPQKFVHLVGCHDGKIGRSSKARPVSEPVKR